MKESEREREREETRDDEANREHVMTSCTRSTTSTTGTYCRVQVSTCNGLLSQNRQTDIYSLSSRELRSTSTVQEVLVHPAPSTSMVQVQSTCTSTSSTSTVPVVQY